MLALYGINGFGFAPYFLCAFAIALLFAIASWFAIEKPSLSLKNLFAGPSDSRRLYEQHEKARKRQTPSTAHP
jgi:peptidoglycan/LPS O-acetylase OafA/YrhL